MKPKQKAENLYTKYVDELGVHVLAKQCALIAVDEMINETSLGLILIEWWKEVRKEIEKL